MIAHPRMIAHPKETSNQNFFCGASLIEAAIDIHAAPSGEQAPECERCRTFFPASAGRYTLGSKNCLPAAAGRERARDALPAPAGIEIVMDHCAFHRRVKLMSCQINRN